MTVATEQLKAEDILSQARELLTPLDQWVKGAWIEENPENPEVKRACAMGAVLLAESILGTEADGIIFGNVARTMIEDDPEFKRAVKVLADVIYDNGLAVIPDLDDADDTQNGDFRDPYAYFEDGDYTDFIIEFNDHHATTHDDVLAAFDAAIKELKK